MRSQTTLLLKYSMGVHLIPSWTYSSCRAAHACLPAPACKLLLLLPSGPAHLLRLQRQLDEDLLQLLVDKVDAELLESVFLQENTENLIYLSRSDWPQEQLSTLASAGVTQNLLLLISPGKSQSHKCPGRRC